MTFKKLPDVLTKYAAQERWVTWKYEQRGGKTTKPPYQARNPNRHASSTDPTTWAPFDMTLAAYRAGQADGIGLCLFGSDLAAFLTTRANLGRQRKI